MDSRDVCSSLREVPPESYCSGSEDDLGRVFQPRLSLIYLLTYLPTYLEKKEVGLAGTEGKGGRGTIGLSQCRKFPGGERRGGLEQVPGDGVGMYWSVNLPGGVWSPGPAQGDPGGEVDYRFVVVRAIAAVHRESRVRDG